MLPPCDLAAQLEATPATMVAPAGGLLYSLLHSADPSVFWVAIVEKAAAKLGSYEKLSSARSNLEAKLSRPAWSQHRPVVCSIRCSTSGYPRPPVLLAARQTVRTCSARATAVWRRRSATDSADTAGIGSTRRSPRRWARVAADGNAEVRTADFFVDELPDGVDTAILSSNVLFSTPRHAELLGRCADALAPGGVLLLDVYNARLYLQDDEPGDAAGGDDDMLVRVTDELGRDWNCYERDPTIDTERQRISQPYEFVSGGETFQETLVHNYLLPEELEGARRPRPHRRQHGGRL